MRYMGASQVAGLVPGTATNSPQSASWSKPSGRLSLDHEFLPDLMGYISYNRGFKSGTFNAVVTPGSTIGPPVQPETLDDYSFGEKAEFFDHRLRVNSEAFWYAYKNIQVTRIVAGGTALSNAARATIKGLDVDAASLREVHHHPQPVGERPHQVLALPGDRLQDRAGRCRRPHATMAPHRHTSSPQHRERLRYLTKSRVPDDYVRIPTRPTPARTASILLPA